MYIGLHKYGLYIYIIHPEVLALVYQLLPTNDTPFRLEETIYIGRIGSAHARESHCFLSELRQILCF